MLRLLEYEKRPGGDPDRFSGDQHHVRRMGRGVDRCYRVYRLARTLDNVRSGLVASRDFEPLEDFEPSHYLERFFGTAPSLRGLSRATGIPYSTLQGIASGATGRPSARTVRRIESYLEQLPHVTTERRKTVAEDAILWTPEKLANLVPPPGARKFQLIGRGLGRESGGARSMYIDLNTHHPADFLNEPGFNIRALQRVVWAGFDDR